MVDRRSPASGEFAKESRVSRIPRRPLTLFLAGFEIERGNSRFACCTMSRGMFEHYVSTYRSDSIPYRSYDIFAEREQCQNIHCTPKQFYIQNKLFLVFCFTIFLLYRKIFYKKQRKMKNREIDWKYIKINSRRIILFLNWRASHVVPFKHLHLP